MSIANRWLKLSFSLVFSNLVLTGYLLPASAGYQNPAFDRGCGRMSHGDWDGAVESFGEAIGFDQTNKEAFFKRGQCFYNLKNTQLAIEDFSHVIQMDPSDADAFLWRGTANAKSDHHDEAVHDYLKAIHLKPELAQQYEQEGGAGVAAQGDAVQVNRGEVLNKRWGAPLQIVTNKRAAAVGSPENQGAIKDYKEAMAIYLNGEGSARGRGNGGESPIQPDKPGPDSDLTTTSMRIEELDAAIKSDPSNASFFFRRGRQYRLQGNFDKALADYNEAIRLNPMKSRFYIARARLYHEHGDTVLSQADIKKAQSVDPKAPRHIDFKEPGGSRKEMPDQADDE